MQFDYSKLLGRVKEFGYTQEGLAEEIGLTKATMSLKLNNKAYFTQPEIEKIREILCIAREDIGLYFFYPKSSEKLNKQRGGQYGKENNTRHYLYRDSR